MPCYAPVHGYTARQRHKSGKRRFTTRASEAASMTEVIVPCGKCLGCRLAKSRDSALRCVHEAQMHEHNTFITLTYKNEPPDKSLHHSHFQQFMYRYRASLSPQTIRFFMCGEYGAQRSRPHYHALIFGHEFSDSYLHHMEHGKEVYTSPTLEKLWRRGFVTTGSVTFQSAAYVARYILKKQSGEQAAEHYSTSDEYGQHFPGLTPEYNRMSLRPGIGAKWWEKYHANNVMRGHCILPNKNPAPIPKYYQTLLGRTDPAGLLALKQKAKAHHMSLPEDSLQRQTVKHQSKLLQIRKLKRNLHE